jgi:hypothetical protein
MICQYMGGNLTLVKSQEGVGSKFSILIPVLVKIEDFDDEDEDSWTSRTPSESHYSRTSDEPLFNSSECDRKKVPAKFKTQQREIGQKTERVQ